MRQGAGLPSPPTVAEAPEICTPSEIHTRVLPASLVYTDESTLYAGVESLGYTHRRIKHGARIYVQGDVHTNTIENFFGLVKNGIRGVYHSVSRRHLPTYVAEYEFRFNHRRDETPMFKTLLGRATAELAA
jgi:transposase